ncbi:MAG: hypothetical protein JEY96_15085 [Bacteroidales bacterium]|nr:hypothetical protein [Bacteroidales bacterium]
MKSVQLFHRVWTVIYFLSPFYTFVKILIISFLIYQAVRIVKKLDAQFWGFFYIVLLAQLVLLIPDLLELIWFTFIKTDYSMADVDYFNPLSIVNLINYESISSSSYKLMSSINVFNVLYWGLLIILIKKFVKINLKDSSVVVLCFYGAISFIVFFVYLLGVYKMSYGL